MLVVLGVKQEGLFVYVDVRSTCSPFSQGLSSGRLALPILRLSRMPSVVALH